MVGALEVKIIYESRGCDELPFYDYPFGETECRSVGICYENESFDWIETSLD